MFFSWFSRSKQPAKAKQSSTAKKFFPAKISSAAKQASPLEQLPGSTTENANESNNQPLEQHLFIVATGATLDADVIVNLDTEDLSNRVDKQVAFGDASNAHIKGGFYGAGSASVAAQIAKYNLQRQMAQDTMNANLEKERLAIQIRQVELEAQRLQFEREKRFGIKNQMNGTSDELDLESSLQ